LGHQHPRQHQILRLPGIARLVVRAKATLVCPPGGRGEVALGQQQPRPLRRDGVDQAGQGRARRDPPGLLDGVQRTDGITAGLPDPGQRRQPRGQRQGVGELAAQGYAIGEGLQGCIELAPLVGHLGHAHLRDARGGQGRPPWRRGELRHAQQPTAA
jgi:hypothetical protein